MKLRPWRKTARWALVATVGLVAVSTAATGGPAASAAQQTKASFVLKGGGSWGPYHELLPWQNALSDAKTSVDLQYTAHGTVLGRKDFADGNLDFVISAVPFTPDELTKVSGGASGVIAAPIQVSSMAFVVQQPVPEGLVSLTLKCDPDDPNVVDPSKCIVKKPYTGPVKLPAANLAAMSLKYQGSSTPPLTSWNNAGVLQAMGVPNFTTPLLAGPAPVLRSDQDEMNLFLQQYAVTAAPAVWNGLKQSESRVVWEPITERLPRQAGASRDGVTQQASQLVLGGGDPASGTISNFTAGVMAPMPASALDEIKESYPKAKVQAVQVQNANGDWVTPTPDSINAAVNAGAAAPMYALTNKVPGAYPLVWVDNLYAPAKGLSIDKMEALATVIRYIATAGQDAAAPVGEGKLSAPLVALSLDAANQLIRSNCEGAEHVVESTDPGPYAPDVPAMKTIGTMAHCAPGAAAPTSGDAGGFTGSGSGSSSDFVSTGSGTSGSGSTTDAGAATDPTSLESDGGAAAVLSASKLPLPLPDVGGGVDRFATLLLGAGAYLVFRKPVRRLLRKEPA